MRTSSFLMGLTIGAVACSVLSKKGNMPSAKQARKYLHEAKDKVMDITFPGMDSMLSKVLTDETTKDSGSDNKSAANKVITPEQKAENMDLLKSFIRSNPDVKKEVEKVLKESHTAIPGL
ncbi:hypothetical protein [Paenibacillus sp. Marseille-Q4541]|uniref:hypothetical protein n=1 Tax=Paenibacillus sp. Marseille-Q4541 TaxID=2831522 RepID=UPI001BA6B0CB|nr:hypothetical protein [Paenibacillus sp. Marseille-Q4541]